MEYNQRKIDRVQFLLKHKATTDQEARQVEEECRQTLRWAQKLLDATRKQGPGPGDAGPKKGA